MYVATLNIEQLTSLDSFEGVRALPADVIHFFAHAYRIDYNPNYVSSVLTLSALSLKKLLQKKVFFVVSNHKQTYIHEKLTITAGGFVGQTPHETNQSINQSRDTQKCSITNTKK